MAQSTQLTYCTYEDRPTEYVGLAVLALSLIQCNPNAELFVFGKNIPTWFRRFGQDHASIIVSDDETFRSSGWSVKPELLLKLLNRGKRSVVWLDADMVVTADLSPLFESLQHEDMVVAEQPRWAKLNAYVSRADAWGFECVREFSPPLNSCVVGVTSRHVAVLQQWLELMDAPEYVSAQGRRFASRPVHVASDQEVLHALLSAREFGDLGVKVLRAGRDIAQLHMADGYTAGDRIRHLWGHTPPIVHSQAYKPWRGGAFRPIHHDVSPYLYVSKQYADQLPTGSAWAVAQTRFGRVLRLLTFEEPNLGGLIFAVFAGAQRSLRVRTRLKSLFG